MLMKCYTLRAKQVSCGSGRLIFPVDKYCHDPVMMWVSVVTHPRHHHVSRGHYRGIPSSWHKYYLIIDMRTLNWGSSNVISHGSWIGKWFLVVQALSRKQYFFLDKNSCYAPTKEMFTLFIMTPQPVQWSDSWKIFGAHPGIMWTVLPVTTSVPFNEDN